MRAHRHARTLTNTEALVPEIEESAVNRRPLQALFLLLWGGAQPATGPGAIQLQITCYVGGVGHPKISSTPAVAIRRLIGHGEATSQRQETLPVASFPTSNGAIPLGGTGGTRPWRENHLKIGRAADRIPFSGPCPIFVHLLYHSRSPPTDHSGGDGESPSRQRERIAAGGIQKPPRRGKRRREERYAPRNLPCIVLSLSNCTPHPRPVAPDGSFWVRERERISCRK